MYIIENIPPYHGVVLFDSRVFEPVFHWVLILPPLSALHFLWSDITRQGILTVLLILPEPANHFQNFDLFFWWDFWVCSSWSAMSSWDQTIWVMKFSLPLWNETNWWLKNLVSEILVLFWISRHLVMVKFYEVRMESNILTQHRLRGTRCICNN